MNMNSQKQIWIERFFRETDMPQEWLELRELCLQRHSIDQRIEYFQRRNNYTRIDREDLSARLNNLTDTIVQEAYRLGFSNSQVQNIL